MVTALTATAATTMVYFFILITAVYIKGMRERTPIIDRPGEGIRKVQRWLEGSEIACVDAVGMNAANFRQLVEYLESEDLIKSTVRLPASMRVAMTLYMLRKAMGYRTLRDVFQISPGSISVAVNEVIAALVHPRFYFVWINQPTPETIQRDHLKYTDPKLVSLTANCLGALDGSHIFCIPPSAECAPFRNRKGYHSFNVLAAVTFDGLFCYVYAGWEGSAHDGRVFKDAIARGGLKIPNGYYYLGDAGYGLGPHLLVPFRGIRYHLREIGIAKQRPRNDKELFNLRHSQVRNAVERAFGRLKRKFKILATGSPLPIGTQRDIVYTCCALLNFMQNIGEQIDLDLNQFTIGPARMEDSDESEGEEDVEPEVVGGAAGMEILRAKISKKMWRQCQTVLVERHSLQPNPRHTWLDSAS